MNLISNRRDALHAAGVLVLLALVLPFAIYAVPQLVGAEHSYVVLSSSMSPTYEAGDVVVVNEVPPETLQVGDVITFVPPGAEASQGGVERITHRIVDVVHRDGELLFRTKGDANEDADRQLIPAENVVGRVMFGIPYIGYVLVKVGGPIGWIALVVIPAALLIVGEFWDLYKAATATPTEPEDQDAEASTDGGDRSHVEQE